MVEDKHDAVLSVSSAARPEQLRADALACDDAVRKGYLVTVRYVEQLKLAGLPWELSWKDRFIADGRIVPYWAQRARRSARSKHSRRAWKVGGIASRSQTEQRARSNRPMLSAAGYLGVFGRGAPKRGPTTPRSGASVKRKN
jgi:hypothetical protein